MRRCCFLLLAAVAVPLTGCGAFGIEFIQGSGTPETAQYEVHSFKAVEVHNAFEVAITRAEHFEVAVTTDDNVLRYVKVDETGDKLTVSLEPGKNISTRSPMKVRIAMPEVEKVDLSGACKGQIGNFNNGKNLSIQVSGASSLNGEVEVKKLEIAASGASSVTLRGRADEANLTASGASHLHLEEFKVAAARVELSGASTASISAREKLDYGISGASKLRYHGHPTLGDQQVSGASSARQED